MRHIAHLLLATAALHVTCAASLPERTRLVPEPTPEVKDNVPTAPIDEQPIKAIENVNALRAKPEDIPVAVIIEDPQPAIKINEINDDEEIHRPAVDLRNPGPPQRQEHETQNPDHFPDAQEKLAAVRNTILQTHDLLRQGVKDVGDDISNWLSTNEQISEIQQNIKSLKETFSAQIQKLNKAIQGLATPSQAVKPEESPEQPKADFTEVENSIEILENNFNNGVRALSEGVSIVAILRAEDEAGAPAQPTAAPSPSSPTTSDPGQNILMNFLSNMQLTMSESFKNVTTAMSNAVSNVPGLQNFINRSTTAAPAVLADTPEGSTQAPANNPWQINWQLPNFFGQSQGQGQGQQTGQQPAQQQGSVVQNFQNGIQNIQNGFQNNPLIQNLLNLFTTTAKPAEAVGSDTVPVKVSGEKQPQEAAPAASPTPAPEGPIRQILSNSPVVQRISGTMQKIQSSINNPEEPRDKEKSDTEKSDDIATKGHGNGGINGGGSDNIIPSGLKSDKEPVKEEIISEKEPEKESSPIEVSEKTE